MSPEEVAAEIKSKVSELNDLIKEAQEKHNVTTQLLTDKDGVEARCWLRKAL